MFVLALLVAAPLLACKRRKTVPTVHPSTPASTAPIASPTTPPSAEAVEDPSETGPEPAIDASRATDKQLCVKAGKTPDPITKETPAHLIRAMRSALRSVRTSHVYGVTMMEIPAIKSWRFEVRASRELGLVYDAEAGDKKIRIVQVPSGQTYARGRFLFSSHPELIDRALVDMWYEVPQALLEVNAADAHPDGPQGVFGMDVGYKAAIASFAQEAIGWYPDRQAEWLFKQPKRPTAGGPIDAKELGRIDSAHHEFAGCQAVLINRRSQTIQLSASDKPLPFQQDPTPGVISGRFRWSDYNETFAKQAAPPDAVTLASLLARR